MTEQITAVTQPWHDGQILDVMAVMNALTTTIVTRTLFAAGVDESTLTEIQQCSIEHRTASGTTPVS